MKAREVRLLSQDELDKKLTDGQNELMNLRFQVVTGQLTDTSRLKETRRLVALYQTISREREIAAQEGVA
jgi:large subunit ribosomal protein L29